MKDLKNHIQNITKPLIRKNGFVTPQIIFDWPVIVGTQLAEITTPIKIAFPAQKNTNGTLHIEVIGAQAPIIQQLEHEIIEKIATYFGFKAVSKIKLIHTKDLPLENKVKKTKPLSNDESDGLDKMLDGLQDEDLKNTLRSMGELIIRRDKHEQNE